MSGFLLSESKKIGPHLEMRWEIRGSSRVPVGTSGFLSNCDGYFGELLEFHKGSQASFRVVRENLGLVSNHCKGKGTHYALRGESRGVSWVVVGSSGFLLSCNYDLREPLLLPQGSLTSFRVLRGTSGLILSHCRQIGCHLNLRCETQGSSTCEA